MTTKDSDGYLVYVAGKWVEESAGPNSPKDNYTSFADIKYYYANLIDYARVLMIVLAGFTVVWDWPLTSAFLIIVSTLLDWIDGPVARKYNQCSIFGSGVDWLADVQTQIVTCVWWSTLDRSVLPWLMIMTTVEVACAIFDFAMTATGRYPKLNQKTGFLVILNWCSPCSNYTWFGTFLWLAYPIFSVTCCLDLSWGQPGGILGLVLATLKVSLLLFILSFLAASENFETTQYTMFLPAVMYGWCELAYLIHILNNWREPSRGAAAKKSA